MGNENKYNFDEELIKETNKRETNLNSNLLMIKREEFTKKIKYYLEEYGIKEFNLNDVEYYSYDFSTIDENENILYFSIFNDENSNTVEINAYIQKIKITDINKLYDYLNLLNIKYPMLNFHYTIKYDRVDIYYTYDTKHKFISYRQFSRVLDNIFSIIKKEKEFINFLFNKEYKIDYDIDIIEARYNLIMEEIYETLVNKEKYKIQDIRVDVNGNQCIQLNFSNYGNICESEINIAISNKGNIDDFDVLISCNYRNTFKNNGNKLTKIINEINNNILIGKFIYLADIISYTHVYHVSVNNNVNISMAVDTALAYLTKYFCSFKNFIK